MRLSAPILIAGFGSAGRRHFRNLRSLGYRKFVFLRSGLGVLNDREIADFPSTHSLEVALSYKPKIIVVTTPSATHLEIALAAAEAGCDLYIEKPLGHDLKNIDRLLAAIRKRHLVAMVGCQFRFHPMLVELRAMICRGQLGCIAGAAAEYGEYLPGWHPWEDHRNSYSARAELGGGAILTLIHPLDYLHNLFGEWRRIQASVRRVSSLDTPAGEDWSDINVEFVNGVLAHAHVDYVQRPATHRLSVVGDRGRAICDFEAGELRWWPTQGEMIERRVPDGFERNTMFLDAMHHFLHCVRDRTEPQIPIADGIAVLKMALEARRVASDQIDA
ncbi:Gfo/Idh/MocA family protein [Hyphomicrobium sp. 99]|uniref:Gfo/Idh/MocA family protein n=1 Tax=Hyphomicrobium sp. 99 TaxID=1163419 RepID=UPI0035283288